jgi:hypothetical protein
MVLRPRDVSVYCPADDGLSWFWRLIKWGARLMSCLRARFYFCRESGPSNWPQSGWFFILRWDRGGICTKTEKGSINHSLDGLQPTSSTQIKSQPEI